MSASDEQRSQLRKLLLMVARLDAGEVLTAGDLMETLEATAMLDRYFKDEERARLDARREGLSPGYMRKIQQDWTQLFDKLEQARMEGKRPDDETLRPLVQKAGELIATFTGGETDIAASLERMTAGNPQAMFDMWGVSTELGEYYFTVMRASR